MKSGGLTFTQDAGGTLGGQPVKYQDTRDSRNSAGGTYLFRSDFAARVVGRTDGKTGVFRSTTFTLGPGEITFDYSGSGGYVALCKGDECKEFPCRLKSTTMKPGQFSAGELAPWVGADVYLTKMEPNSEFVSSN